MTIGKILSLSVFAHCASAWSPIQWTRSTHESLSKIDIRDAASCPFILEVSTPSWNCGDGGSKAPMQYVGCGGYGTDNKNLASLWTIINGQLVSLTEGGYLSSSKNSGNSSPLAPSQRVQSISSGFAVSDGTLNWSNNEFSQGSAKFCQQQSDGLIRAYSGTAPAGCKDSTLRAVSPSTTESPGSSGSSGPSGSSRSSGPSGSSGSSGSPGSPGSSVSPISPGSPVSPSSTSDNAPSSTSSATSCQVQTGTSPPTFKPNLSSPSAQDVVDSTLAWLNDVCTVDSFLNHPVGGPTSLETTIAFALDEPVQLKTLSSIPSLSDAGKSAAAALEVNFPGIPANLYNVQNGTATPLLATTAINLVRCCIVLPSIKTLIQEAADATGAFSDTTIPEPVYPVPCASINCNAGASPGTTS